MPWKESTPVKQRKKFIMDKIKGHDSHAMLCRRYGISRQVGYKWWNRFLEGGVIDLLDRSCAHRSHPATTSQSVVELLIQARHEHPTWGPRKLLAWLRARYPGLHLPAPSTVGRILKLHGLTAPRRRARAKPSRDPLGPQDLPNQTWAIDFKGQFKTQDGRWCYPLTLQDGCSRYLLRCQALLQPRGELVQPILEAAFRQYGMPEAIRSDNGPPFASSSFTGLTYLSAWWVRLGIRLDRTKPGNPQQNGRLERLHRTLKAETTTPAANNIRGQQLVFDRFRNDYNMERPHEALAQRPPATRYQPSKHRFPIIEPLPRYPPDMRTTHIYSSGLLYLSGWEMFISGALAGEQVGLSQIDDHLHEIWYYANKLGEVDTLTGLFSNGVCTRQAGSHKRCRDRTNTSNTFKGRSSSLRSSSRQRNQQAKKCQQ